MGKLAEKFFKFDARLEKAGQPPCSPWWRAELTKFFDAYESGAADEYWTCVGRGGAKSTALYKVALFFTLFGEFDIPKHETHYATLISRNRTEATKGAAIIARWLDALGVKHDPTSDVIHIAGTQRGIRILSASVAGASGWRAFFVGADEFSKWNREGEAAMLDADEVLASARAQTATHARAPLFVASTPWIQEGSFYESIVGGSVDGRVVSGPAPSWAANPAITEAQTRRKEPNPARWRREYACEFSATFDAEYFSDELVMKCTDPGRLSRPEPSGRYMHVVAIDPAFVSDGFGIAIAHVEDREGGAAVVVLDYVHSLQGDRGGGGLTPAYAIANVAHLRYAFPGGRAVLSDQHAAEALAPMFLESGMLLLPEPWSQSSKVERFEFVRNLMRDGRLRLPDDPFLRREIANIGVRRTGAGVESISSRGRDDRVFAAVQAVWHAARGGALLAAGSTVQTSTFGTRRISLVATGSVTGRGGPGYATVESEIAASIGRDR